MTPAESQALPSAPEVMARASGENFPVALRLLGRREREQLLAIYGFARLVDELGDAHDGDRLAILDWLEGELERAYRGEARHPLMQRLQQELARQPLPRGPFERLIEANRTDQRVKRYATFEQLLAYCELSANPVGELVLAVFHVATPERIARSNDICTALQLIEHWQDVAEDWRAGRVYIPAEDIERFGIGSAEDLLRRKPDHRRRMRMLIQFEVSRARELLQAGAPLVRTLGGRPRLAVAGFIGGGRAALGAIERAGFEVLDGPPRPSRLRVGAALMLALVTGGLR